MWINYIVKTTAFLLCYCKMMGFAFLIVLMPVENGYWAPWNIKFLSHPHISPRAWLSTWQHLRQLERSTELPEAEGAGEGLACLLEIAVFCHVPHLLSKLGKRIEGENWSFAILRQYIWCLMDYWPVTGSNSQRNGRHWWVVYNWWVCIFKKVQFHGTHSHTYVAFYKMGILFPIS